VVGALPGHGAVLAGMVISESVYVHESPARSSPSGSSYGVFFISVGMLLASRFSCGTSPMILLFSIGGRLAKGSAPGRRSGP